MDGPTGKLDRDPSTVQEVTLRVSGKPFARGGNRNVYWAAVDGARYVAKRYMGQIGAAPKNVIEQVTRNCRLLLV